MITFNLHKPHNHTIFINLPHREAIKAKISGVTGNTEQTGGEAAGKAAGKAAAAPAAAEAAAPAAAETAGSA